MATEPCEHAGLIRRLHTSLMLVNDLDLDELEQRYGGIGSVEHDGVQNLIALARELRMIERALGDMHRGRRPGRARHARARRRSE
jgi:hypothetical protein